LPTMKSGIMILIALLVAVALFVIFKVFIKKLKKIENDFWGAASAEAEQKLAEARAKVFADAQAKAGKTAK